MKLTEQGKEALAIVIGILIMLWCLNMGNEPERESIRRYNAIEEF